MHADPHIVDAIKAELSDRQRWRTRAVVLAFGALSGLGVVVLTWLAEHALSVFHWGAGRLPWAPLVWTPLCTVAIVWVTRRWAQGAAGSGIPQVMVALQPEVGPAQRPLFVSMKLTVSKTLLTAWGLLAGLSLGREGPSVQVGAGIMHAARHWLPDRSAVSDHALLVAGGSAGIAAAFNTPLGGIMFAIEELSRRPEQRNTGLVMAAIVLAGLMGVSAYGNANYFGEIRVQAVEWRLLWPGLVVAVSCGLLGGLFSRLMTRSLTGETSDCFMRWRLRYPLRFAAGCGLAVAVMGVVSGGATFGSGYAHTKALLDGAGDTSGLYVVLKFMSTWITAWSGVPGGIFAPSLAIGGALGGNVAEWWGGVDMPALIALGMAGFLAAVTQAPMTAFIIVMEMVAGHSMVLTLMACALVASAVSRLVSRPLYACLAQAQMRRLPPTAEKTVA
ncbi:MAG TPA: chloride channel protein [Macromonas sp.]|nr:chloride channel protein [Macromonas sp.]